MPECGARQPDHEDDGWHGRNFNAADDELFGFMMASASNWLTDLIRQKQNSDSPKAERRCTA